MTEKRYKTNLKLLKMYEARPRISGPEISIMENLSRAIAEYELLNVSEGVKL